MNTNIVTPRFETIEVTPALAHVWLKHNTANRSLKPHAIRAYATDMREDRWVLNGETIKFSGPDSDHPEKLLDGQNRLHGVVAADVPVTFTVAFNVTDHSQGTMDSGAKRTVADNLVIGGIQNAKILASIASVALAVQSGRIAGGNKFTNATIEAFIADHPQMAASAQVASQYHRRSDVRPSLVGYTHWVLSRIDMDEATAFWRDASEKIGLRDGDPVIALTNRFAEARRNRESLPPAAELSAIYRAWNARRAGKTLRIIKFNSVKGGLIEIPEPR